jgi:hypothetical protein
LNRTPTVLGDRRIFTWSGWLKRGTLGTVQYVFFAGTTSADYGGLAFNGDQFFVTNVISSGGTLILGTQAVFRDPSAWYHFVVSIDTTQALSTNGVRMWVNGVAQTLNVTTYTQNTTFQINNTIQHSVSSSNSGVRAQYFDGYLTDVNFIDGQALTPASFGQIESTTGVWSPKQYVGTYGTNGFYLKFGNTSSVAALGTDSSGNNNTWTVNNVSLTAGVTYDSMLDVPVNYSDSGNGRGNYCTLNPVDVTAGGGGGVANFSNGNLRVTGSAGNRWSPTTMRIPSGKFYFEATLESVPTPNTSCVFLNYGSTYWQYNFWSGQIFVNGVLSTTVAAPVNGDVIGYAVDRDANTVALYKNNTLLNTSSGLSAGEMLPVIFTSGIVDVITINFGQRPFTYTPPAGFRVLNTNNLPTPSIVNGANFMAATTYTGNAAARSLSNAVNNVSFQPDLVWIKSRTPGATSHALFDSTRGTTNYLSSNTTTAETTLAQSLTAFNANGFSLGTDTTLVNANANSYIAWQWRESVTAGLDVVSYAGTGIDRTVAHNLGVAPAMIIVKRSQTGATSNWQVRHTSIAAANSIQLNLPNQAAAATTVWASTAPTSSVFTVGTSADVNASGISYVAYCFAEIAGFSKFGTYTGNGSTDGPFVFCGFRPRWVMYKSTTETTGWAIIDTSRNTSNVADKYLNPNDSTAEGTSNLIDVLSNGFKFRTIAGGNNASGQTYIFAAFAEVPSKYALAR